jgi:hypothetical protein
MQPTDYPVETQKYAKCIEVSKRIRWDIDKDVLRSAEGLPMAVYFFGCRSSPLHPTSRRPDHSSPERAHRGSLEAA